MLGHGPPSAPPLSLRPGEKKDEGREKREPTSPTTRTRPVCSCCVLCVCVKRACVFHRFALSVLRCFIQAATARFKARCARLLGGVGLALGAGGGDVPELPAVVALGPAEGLGAVGRDVPELTAVVALLPAALGLLGVRVLRLVALAGQVVLRAAVPARLLLGHARLAAVLVLRAVALHVALLAADVAGARLGGAVVLRAVPLEVARLAADVARFIGHCGRGVWGGVGSSGQEVGRKRRCARG